MKEMRDRCLQKGGEDSTYPALFKVTAQSELLVNPFIAFDHSLSAMIARIRP